MRWVRDEDTKIARIVRLADRDINEKVRRLFTAAAEVLPDTDEASEDFYYAHVQWAVTEAVSSMWAVLTGWSEEDVSDQEMQAVVRTEEMIRVVAGMVMVYVCESMTKGKNPADAEMIREKIMAVKRRVMGE